MASSSVPKLWILCRTVARNQQQQRGKTDTLASPMHSKWLREIHTPWPPQKAVKFKCSFQTGRLIAMYRTRSIPVEPFSTCRNMQQCSNTGAKANLAARLDAGAGRSLKVLTNRAERHGRPFAI